jgi:hypothetical protein
VLDFLGLRRWRPRSFGRRNPGKYAPIDPATRRRLEEHFAEPNERLARLLGRDFAWEPQAAAEPAREEEVQTPER